MTQAAAGLFRDQALNEASTGDNGGAEGPHDCELTCSPGPGHS